MPEIHIPTLQEEIDRKGVEALTNLVDRLDDGQWSPEQAEAALTTLFECVSGLISRELFELISEASAEIRSCKLSRSTK